MPDNFCAPHDGSDVFEQGVMMYRGALALLLVPALAVADTPAKRTCTNLYFDGMIGGGITRDQERIKTAWIAGGYESAPEACAADINVRVGAVFAVTNQSSDFAAYGAELSLLRWYHGLGSYGVRLAALTDADEVFGSVGLRLNTTAALSLGLDVTWDSNGPTEFGSRTGGDPAFGVQASVGFGGRTSAVLVGLAVVLGVLYASGQE